MSDPLKPWRHQAIYTYLRHDCTPQATHFGSWIDRDAMARDLELTKSEVRAAIDSVRRKQ